LEFKPNKQQNKEKPNKQWKVREWVVKIIIYCSRRLDCLIKWWNIEKKWKKKNLYFMKQISLCIIWSIRSWNSFNNCYEVKRNNSYFLKLNFSLFLFLLFRYKLKMSAKDSKPRSFKESKKEGAPKKGLKLSFRFIIIIRILKS